MTMNPTNKENQRKSVGFDKIHIRQYERSIGKDHRARTAALEMSNNCISYTRRFTLMDASQTHR